ncbi:hypothetical protein [Niallia sp. 03133]|uniref:hypothetical protein n=1 Tax=Niallia sp. 03133 TaxID=3458060 RepID=UPI0040446587
MQKNILNIEDYSQPTSKSTLLENKYLNLPDLLFYNNCNRKYRINRGVFNTVDNWFYEYGVINIVYRRIYILAFFDFVKDRNIGPNSQKFIKFGQGGLTASLKEFTESIQRDKNLYSVK